ncbi:MAG TPA: cysteine rich repeat-containing protein [Devosiaceae bacterium]|jgi:hypothetical protein
MPTKTLTLAVLFLLPALPVTAAALNYQDLRSIRQACGDDIKTLCSDASRGNGRIMQCMAAHADAISPGCADAVKAERAKLPASTRYDTN